MAKRAPRYLRTGQVRSVATANGCPPARRPAADEGTPRDECERQGSPERGTGEWFAERDRDSAELADECGYGCGEEGEDDAARHPRCGEGV